MNIKAEVKALLESEGIAPSPTGKFQQTRYLAGLDLLRRRRPDLYHGRDFVTARQAVIENAKGRGG